MRLPLKLPPLPGAQEWLFSVRTFAAAMLALYIGLWIDLPRPYWAMATAYIASQPLSGATRSKAVYRGLGTLLGAAAAVVLVPNLVDAPVLLSLAMALWTAICLVFALLDRTPRSYVFMLAGYTAAIIGFPSVTEPGAIFDTALARVEEITLGIACAAVVASLVLPQPVGPVLLRRLDAWLLDAERWSLDALRGRRDDADARASRRQLAARTAEIGMLASYLGYDTSVQMQATRWVDAIRVRMLMLLPLLSSIADRVEALRAMGALPADSAPAEPAPAGAVAAPDTAPGMADAGAGPPSDRSPGLQPLLDAVASWLRVAPSGRAEADRLRGWIAALRPALDRDAGWDRIILASLLMRLRELVDIAQDCRDLRAHIAAGGGRLPGRLAFPIAPAAERTVHRDLAMALLSAGAAAAAVLLCCAAWIATAWPEGAVAAEMAAVACCFFAAQDDPAPAILSFLRWSGVAVLVDGLYLFGVLPAVNDFVILALVLAPVFIFYGLLVANPATTSIGAALSANGATLLSLQSTYNADFASFANSGLALLAGMWLAAIVTRLMRSVGADWSARRLLRAGWRTMAEAAAGTGRGPRDRSAFAALMLDRLGLLAPRLAAIGPGSEAAAEDMLAELRIGLNVLDLRHARLRLPPPARAGVERVLDGIADHFRARLAGAAPRGDLLLRLDGALRVVADQVSRAHGRTALLGLVGVRRGLFPDAPYATPPEPGADRGSAPPPSGAESSGTGARQDARTAQKRREAA